MTVRRRGPDDPRPELLEVDGRTFVFERNGVVREIAADGAITVVSTRADAFDASHQAVLRRQLGASAVQNILDAPDPTAEAKSLLLRVRAESAAAKKKPTRRKIASDLKAVAKEIAALPARAPLPPALLRRALELLEVKAGQEGEGLFASESEFIARQLDEVKGSSAVRRLARWVLATISTGPGASETLKMFTTSSIHLAAELELSEVFGERVTSTVSGFVRFMRDQGVADVTYRTWRKGSREGPAHTLAARSSRE